MRYRNDDTIAAPASGPSEGGIAVIRISGPEALTLLCRHVRSVTGRELVWEPRRLSYGVFVDQSGEHIDEVMAVYLQRPRSFTGEETAEIHCHGGRLIVRRILDLLVESGVRLAQPGEFTRRAFLNGRLDLTQAEAVADLISARSDTSRRVALMQLEGSLYKQISAIGETLTALLVLIEAHIDFAEDEVGQVDIPAITAEIERVRVELQRLISGYEEGRILRDGASLLILGRPNVGKSSLLNVLVGEERAIVSDLPGTTRDTIEEGIVLSGIPLRIVDSAGIRHSDDTIEQLGVQRALSRLPSADLVLLVFDGSRGFLPEDQEILDRCLDRPVLLVRNKSDLSQQETLPAPPLPTIPFSCRDKTGHRELPLKVADLLLAGKDDPATGGALICDLRHKEALVRTLDALDSFARLLQDDPPLELAACEVRSALNALGEVTGETTPDEILDRIFGRFCIGK